MELKVFKETLAAYAGQWETRLELPVETELLIPDYLPAVFKIVKCLIEPVVLQNHTASGRWQGEGYLRCTVFYQSDEAGSRLYRTEQKFAFEKTAELPAGQYAEGPAFLWGELEYCNCRAVSEHRIDLRGAYALYIAVLSAAEIQPLTALADCGVEQRTRSIAGQQLAAAEEKTFTAETALPLPGAGEAILDIDGFYTPEVTTLQTGQVSCKGLLQMQVCYRPNGEEDLTTRQKAIPIQQSVEVPGAAEGDNAVCWGEVLSSTLTAGEGDDTTLSVTWKLHIELWRPVAYTVVADAYSTLCQTQLQRQPLRLLQTAGALQETVKVEIEDDLPDAAVEVKGCFVTLGAVSASAEGENVTVTGKGVAHVLCADERGELTCYDKAFTWKLPQTLPGAPENCLPRLRAAVSRVTSGKNGASMRVEADITVGGALLWAQELEAVTAVELGEEFPDKNDGPALYLYYAAKGERIFDIAKRYHARARDLAAANHIETGETAPQELVWNGETACLLIPAAL